MKVCSTVQDFRAACDDVRRAGETLGLVPTMGALHRGHLALAAEARRHASRVAVTIFVNPTQFGPNEDFSKYPRPIERDLRCCEEAGVDLVFTPDRSEMYAPDDATRVVVSGLTRSLCGASRPGHFEGVATVVTKLFAVTGPCTAVFGRKDYQQLKVVERFVRDLLLPVTIVGHPIVRESDGLALSSRNMYLSADERTRALAIPRALAAAVEMFARGERRAGRFVELVSQALEASGLRRDYAIVADSEQLLPYEPELLLPARALLAVAAFAGSTRLIDNVVLGEDPGPLP